MLNLKHLLSLFDWVRGSFAGTRRGVTDVAYSLIPQGVSAVSGIVIVVLIARSLGPQDMGRYALIASVYLLVTELSNLGIGQTAIRYASLAVTQGNLEAHYAVLRWAFRVRFLLVSTLSCVVLLLSPMLSELVWNAPELSGLIRMSLAISVFSSAAQAPSLYFQANRKFRKNSIILAGQTLISLGGTILVIWSGQISLQSLVLVNAVAACIGFAVFMGCTPYRAVFDLRDWSLRSVGDFVSFLKIPVFEAEVQQVQKIGVFAFYLLVSSLTVLITQRIDVWLMGHYLSKGELGVYSVMMRFTLPLTMLLSAVNTALWPRASGLVSYEAITGLLKKTFQLTLVVAVVGCIYSVVVPYATPYLFGTDFSPGILIGQLLCLRSCISILVCPIGLVGYSFGFARQYVFINIFQLVVVVMLNVLLLPRIGLLGAVFALLLNEIIGGLATAMLVKRRIKQDKKVP